MFELNNVNMIEELSYLLIIKENPYLLSNKFITPNKKQNEIDYKNLNLTNIYTNKFKKFKEKSFQYLKLIRSFIHNPEIENYVRINSIKIIKGIKNSFNFFFKFDYNIVFQVFKIIIYYLIKGLKIEQLSNILINNKVSEKIPNSNIEKHFIINKMLKITIN